MMTPDRKHRFRDARGAAQAGEEAPSQGQEQEFSRIPEQAPAEPAPAEHADAADDAAGNHPEPDGDEVPMEGQEALQQRLQGYNASASPGREVDFNDPSFLKFVLLKLLEREATSEGQEAPSQPQPPPQGAY